MKNYVALVIDESGSMNHLSPPVTKLYKETLKQLREKKLVGQDTYLSLIRFGSLIEIDYSAIDINSTINYNHKSTLGQTALLDGVGEAINSLSQYQPAKTWVQVDSETQKLQSEDVSYLVIVLTDGGENCSRIYNRLSLRKLINEKQLTGKWTFAFNVPDQNGINYLNQFNIPLENINVWAPTEEGVREVEQKTSSGIGRFYQARSAGGSSVCSFYSADLSNVKSTDLKALNNVQNNFKVLEVKKECDVTTFIKENMGEYIKGNTYYQLTKSEKVQATKKVVIREKGKAAIYEGAEARKLIGIPDNQEVRVKPYNLSNYEIFIQSSSNNRKLVRGTKVLVKKY